jgi:hypothetical protein
MRQRPPRHGQVQTAFSATSLRWESRSCRNAGIAGSSELQYCPSGQCDRLEPEIAKSNLEPDPECLAELVNGKRTLFHGNVRRISERGRSESVQWRSSGWRFTFRASMPSMTEQHCAQITLQLQHASQRPLRSLLLRRFFRAWPRAATMTAATFHS